MRVRPIDYLIDSESIYLPVEYIQEWERDGNALLFHGSGRFCSLERTALFNQHMGSGAEFWRKHFGEESEEINLRLEFIDQRSFRIRVSLSKPWPKRETPMVIRRAHGEFAPDVSEDAERWLIDTGMLRIEIGRNPYALSIYDAGGRPVARMGGPESSRFGQFDAVPLGFIIGSEGTRACATLGLKYDEKILGMGERFSGINRRGETISNVVDDGLGNASPRCYKPIPFMLSSNGYGIFFNTACPFHAWIGSQSHTEASFIFDEAELDCYFFYGPRIEDVIRQYTALTGRAPMPPAWSFGYWISRNSFNAGEEALDVARRFRREGLPADVIHLDPPWMGIVGEDESRPACNLAWHDGKFGSREEIIGELRELGFHTSLWQLPYIDERSDIYEEGKRVGAFVEGIVSGDDPHKVGIIDFSNPKAVEWYQEKLGSLLENGADVIKVDFGETSPTNVDYHGFSGKEMRNLYPLLYSKAVFEVTKRVKGEALIWARAAYAGSQRYPVHWSGDPSSDWETLPHVLKGGLSLALSGFTFWANDLGGYLGTPSPELYIRWTQFAMFCSHVRGHGNTPREPWEFGEEALENFHKYVTIRYRMMPYILKEAEYAAAEGLPFIRPLVLDYQDDPTVFHIEDEYLFGRDILVAPVLTEGVRERKVYLPEGRWIDFWTREAVDGPRWIVYPCPLDTLPIFVCGEAVSILERILNL